MDAVLIHVKETSFHQILENLAHISCLCKKKKKKEEEEEEEEGKEERNDMHN